MTTPSTPVSPRREPDLAGQTVVLIGGSAGIGLETARRARAEGADVILTGRNPQRLRRAALELGAQRTAASTADSSSSPDHRFLTAISLACRGQELPPGVLTAGCHAGQSRPTRRSPRAGRPPAS